MFLCVLFRSLGKSVDAVGEAILQLLIKTGLVPGFAKIVVKTAFSFVSFRALLRRLSSDPPTLNREN